MMIFNWPEECPKCAKAYVEAVAKDANEASFTEEQLEELKKKGNNFVPIELDPKQFDKPVPPNAQAFHCKDCDAVWVEAMVTDKTFPVWLLVAEKYWYEPLAILSPNPAHVRKLFDISKTINHTIIKLEEAFRAGERRIAHVQSPEGSKKLWVPAPGRLLGPGESLSSKG